ncbi:hypothetical protein [Streptomyces sp. V3I7]|uniref:Rv1733c family protein n=1 Tax=Streptomyces sp. V3I7 TaxID=3042278 RepID=UPI0027895066|nr:hypothetical protein [Streptomyces sp. V3I7]MDQ0989204.1 hypothetical protein [Streptomyces sp. V3I7]
MRAISGLWRWRHNPLCRTTDLVEAWVALAALMLIVATAPVIGVLVGSMAQDSLQRSARHQLHARHLVTATVVRKLSGAALEPDSEIATARDARSRVLAVWTAPDGAHRRGRAMTSLKSPHRGDHFRFWTNAHGRIVGRPLEPAAATTHAVLAGFGAATLAAVLVEGGRRTVVWHMVRRRYTRWDQAWDRTGPDWGKAGTGS